MSEKPRATLIGIFVVGAVALAVAAVLLFGSGKFLGSRVTYVAYFDGSIKGLSVGSPVLFRGVKVGEVSDIKMEFNLEDLSVRIPVFLECNTSLLTKVSGRQDPHDFFDKMVESGLKAQLQMQSIVTGQSIVALDFHPDKPLVLVGVDNKVPEIPTIPTTVQELSKTFEDIPLKELVAKLLSAVDGLDKLVRSPEIIVSIRSINKTMADVRTLLSTVNKEVVPLKTGINDTTRAARDTMKKVDKVLTMVEGILADDSAPRYELDNALKELAGAARSMRLLAEYLEQHPEALVHGKGPFNKVQ